MMKLTLFCTTATAICLHYSGLMKAPSFNNRSETTRARVLEVVETHDTHVPRAEILEFKVAGVSYEATLRHDSVTHGLDPSHGFLCSINGTTTSCNDIRVNDLVDICYSPEKSQDFAIKSNDPFPCVPNSLARAAVYFRRTILLSIPLLALFGFWHAFLLFPMFRKYLGIFFGIFAFAIFPVFTVVYSFTGETGGDAWGLSSFLAALPALFIAYLGFVAENMTELQMSSPFQ